MIIEYQRIRKDVKPPIREHASDAGLDVFFCPSDGKSIDIHQHESKVLETGLTFEVPHGYMLEIKNRSSMAGKKGLLVGGGVIDSGYSGEIKVNLINVGMNEPVTIQPGDKIAQVVLIPIVTFKAYEKLVGNLYDYPVTMSDRKDGSFGSSGS